MLLKPENLRIWAKQAVKPASIADIETTSPADLLTCMKTSLLSTEAVTRACIDRAMNLKFTETGREMADGANIVT